MTDTHKIEIRYADTGTWDDLPDSTFPSELTALEDAAYLEGTLGWTVRVREIDERNRGVGVDAPSGTSYAARMTNSKNKISPAPNAAAAASEIVAQMSQDDIVAFDVEAWREGVGNMLVGLWATLDIDDVLAAMAAFVADRGY